MSHRTPSTENQVVDFMEVRAQKLDEKRRKNERIFFKQMLGVYCVAGNEQLRALEICDVSESGCAFQIPYTGVNPWPNADAELSLRLYFSQDTYLPVQVRVQHSRSHIDNGTRYLRFGCTVDQSSSSYEAYQQFVRFLKLYSEHAHKDMGDVTLFYL